MSSACDPSVAWHLRPVEPTLAQSLSESLSLSPTVARVLVSRGLSDDVAARRFLQPRLSDLLVPDQMADLSRAVTRISEALSGQQHIAIFGDYDVDGVTSAALIGDYLLRCGARVTMRAARRDEGYGFGIAQADELLGSGCGLLILTDCGTSDVEAVARVAEAGVDVVAVDHHRVADHSDWPGFALINPQRADCGFAYKGLCSAGLAFYVMASLGRALVGAGRTAPDPRDCLDLVALGTVADVAPLDTTNRILVARGLEQLARTERPGLRELIRIADLSGSPPSSEDIAWRLAPRLNAPGRLGDASIALSCLFSRDERDASNWAQRCHAINEQRKEIQRRVEQQAAEQAEARPEDPFVLVAAQGWHPGVIGIVAGRLAQRYGRPAAVIAWEGETGRASARSVAGLDLFEILSGCSDNLLRFGGHAAAAGFSATVERFEALREALCTETQRRLRALRAQPLRLDALLNLEQVDERLIADLRQLQPYGEGNPAPVFAAAKVTVTRVRPVGTEHIALTLSQEGTARPAIGFGLRHKQPEGGQEVDVAFVPEIDDYNGRRLRLRVLDILPAGQGVVETCGA